MCAASQLYKNTLYVLSEVSPPLQTSHCSNCSRGENKAHCYLRHRTAAQALNWADARHLQYCWLVMQSADLTVLCVIMQEQSGEGGVKVEGKAVCRHHLQFKSGSVFASIRALSKCCPTLNYCFPSIRAIKA